MALAVRVVQAVKKFLAKSKALEAQGEGMGVRWYEGASGIQSGRRGLAPVRSVTMRDEEGDPRTTAAEVEGEIMNILNNQSQLMKRNLGELGREDLVWLTHYQRKN